MKRRPIVVKTRGYGNHSYPVSVRVDANHTRGPRNDVALCLEGPVSTYLYLSPDEARALAAALEVAAISTSGSDPKAPEPAE